MIGRAVFVFAPTFLLAVVICAGMLMWAFWPRRAERCCRRAGRSVFTLLVLAGLVACAVTIVSRRNGLESRLSLPSLQRHYEPNWWNGNPSPHFPRLLAVTADSATSEQLDPSGERQGEDSPPQSPESAAGGHASQGGQERVEDARLPDWTRQIIPSFNHAGQVYSAVIHVGPDEPDASFEDKINQEVKRAIEAFVRSLYSRDNRAATRIGLRDEDLPYWRSRLVTATHEQMHRHVVSGDLPPVLLREAWLKLEFPQDVRRHLQAQYEESLLRRRLGTTGVAAMATMVLLASTFGFLKMDTATKGYYSTWLRIAAVAVILGLLGLAAVGAWVILV